MTYTVNDPRPLYQAVVARLEAETGKEIGQGAAPEDESTPYGVLYAQDDDETFGSLNDPNADVWWVFQVTCVGADMNEAQWMQAAARTALLGWAPTVAGLSPSKVELESGSGVRRDDDRRPPLFHSTDRFQVFTSPS